MKRVGILRGGTGDTYTTSLADGGEIISYILENLGDKYAPVDILVDRGGTWHFGGLPITPSDLARRVDVVWNLSDSRFSNILESFSVRTVGAPSFSSLMGGSREMLKEQMKKFGVNLPRHIIFPKYQEDIDGNRDRYAIRKAKEVFEKFGSPWVVKSFPEDLHMGVHVAKTFGELSEAILDGVSHGASVLVEELIPGTEAEAYSVANFRGEDIYVFPVRETPTPQARIQGSGSRPNASGEKITTLAKNLHKHFGAKSYFHSRFVLHPRRGVFLTGLGFLPNIQKNSGFHRSCELIGSKAHHIIEHILENVR